MADNSNSSGGGSKAIVVIIVLALVAVGLVWAQRLGVFGGDSQTTPASADVASQSDPAGSSVEAPQLSESVPPVVEAVPADAAAGDMEGGVTGSSAVPPENVEGVTGAVEAPVDGSMADQAMDAATEAAGAAVDDAAGAADASTDGAATAGEAVGGAVDGVDAPADVPVTQESGEPAPAPDAAGVPVPVPAPAQ